MGCALTEPNQNRKEQESEKPDQFINGVQQQGEKICYSSKMVLYEVRWIGAGITCPETLVRGVEPESWRWRNSWVFFSTYKSWCERANAATSFDLSTGRLAVEGLQKNLDLSMGQLSRWVLPGSCHSRCRFGRMKGMLWSGIWIRCFHNGKAV